jgi:hypothetical protein
MDVEPPQQPIHSVKDFLLHLLTITVGLLIALALEAGVQYLHHRSLVRDAQHNLTQEISANRAQYEINARWIQENRERLEHDTEQLRAMRAGKSSVPASLSWYWQWNSFSGIAWRTAHDSGAVSYMDPKHIASYSWIYLQQEYINSTALQIVGEETKAGAGLVAANDPANLSATEIQTLLQKTAEINLSLQTLQTTMKSLEEMYGQELGGGTDPWTSDNEITTAKWCRS